MPIIRAVLISLAVHLILTWSIDQVPESWLKKDKPQKLVVELIEAKSADENQKHIVRETPAPASQIDKDQSEEARFLSAQKQRVQLETRARKSGLTQNRQRNALAEAEQNQKRQEASQKNEKSSLEKDAFAHYKPVEFRRALQEEGVSTVGESLPNDVALGSFTALNTDRFQFYSFYSRVEELVRFRWESRVRDAIQVFDRRNMLNKLGNKNWISKMTFLISPEGRLLKVQVGQECGVPAFDQAAIQAFQEVLNFPNPPREMIKSDGMIHLQYSFNVNFNPMAVAY